MIIDIKYNNIINILAHTGQLFDVVWASIIYKLQLSSIKNLIFFYSQS